MNNYYFLLACNVTCTRSMHNNCYVLTCFCMYIHNHNHLPFLRGLGGPVGRRYPKRVVCPEGLAPNTVP